MRNILSVCRNFYSHFISFVVSFLLPPALISVLRLTVVYGHPGHVNSIRPKNLQNIDIFYSTTEFDPTSIPPTLDPRPPPPPSLPPIPLLPPNLLFSVVVGQVKCMDQFEMIRRLDENDAINIFIGDAIKALWTDPGIK